MMIMEFPDALPLPIEPTQVSTPLVARIRWHRTRRQDRLDPGAHRRAAGAAAAEISPEPRNIRIYG